MRVGVNDDGRGPTDARSTGGVRQQCSTDAATHELRRHPKMLKLPGCLFRYKEVEPGNFIVQVRYESGPRGQDIGRDRKTWTPALDVF